MRFALSMLVIVALGFSLPLMHAAGPDDLYLDAYRLIQEGDQLAGSGQAELARQRYTDAETSLKKLKGSYPEYNKNAVDFRLEYVHDRTQALPAPENTPKSAAQKPAPAPRTPEEQISNLNARIAELESANNMLQGKLREALAPQPAALDPHEFTKAQERISELEKQKELLRVSLEQAKAQQPAAADNAMLSQARNELEATQKKLVENVASVASLSQENQRLQQELATAQRSAVDSATFKRLEDRLTTLEQERADWQKQRQDLESKLAAAPAQKAPAESPKIKDLENERDALMKKLNDANKEVYDLRARGQAEDRSSLTNQLANLRARLEVFESRKVPYTKEELALMDKNVPTIATKVEAKPAKRSARELPPGAGIIVAEAERAFAAKRYPEAEAKYKQVLSMDDENPVSLGNLAAIQLEMQKMDEAEANVKKALQVRSDDAYALSLLGMIRFQQGKYDEALDALSRSAQLDPKSAETQNYLGITLSQQGQREAAETALRKAVALNPNYAGAHHNLAVIYATQRPPFLELAKYHYNKALSLGQPPSPELEKQLAGK